MTAAWLLLAFLLGALVVAVAVYMWVATSGKGSRR